MAQGANRCTALGRGDQQRITAGCALPETREQWIIDG
jgi:hypothetical protein